MLEFVEKEPYTSPSNGFRYQVTRVPVFMRKDGLDYFVAYRLVEDTEPGGWGKTHVKVSQIEVDGYKKRLAQTDGRYLKMYGTFDDPLDLLKEVVEKGYTLTYLGQPIDWSKRTDSATFVDFMGNMKEISAAFHYRIYDNELINEVCDALIDILEKETPA